jgi:hypothetical protein
MTAEDIRTRTLVEAIQRINSLHGGDKYQQAWKRAVKELKSMLVEVPKLGTDKPDQISLRSSRPV